MFDDERNAARQSAIGGIIAPFGALSGGKHCGTGPLWDARRDANSSCYCGRHYIATHTVFCQLLLMVYLLDPIYSASLF
jgi:hypothetical protein